MDDLWWVPALIVFLWAAGCGIFGQEGVTPMAEIPERWKELHDYVSECFDADQKVPMARNQLFRLIEELGAAEAAVKKVLAALESVGRVTGDTFCWCPAQAWDCEDSDCIAARDAIRTGEKVLEGKG